MSAKDCFNGYGFISAKCCIETPYSVYKQITTHPIIFIHCIDDYQLYYFLNIYHRFQARNQDFMWRGANEAKVDQTTKMQGFQYVL